MKLVLCALIYILIDLANAARDGPYNCSEKKTTDYWRISFHCFDGVHCLDGFPKICENRSCPDGSDKSPELCIKRFKVCQDKNEKRKLEKMKN